MKKSWRRGLPLLLAVLVLPACSSGSPVTGVAVVSTFIAATTTVAAPPVTVTAVTTARTTAMVTATMLGDNVTVTQTAPPLTATITATATVAATAVAGAAVNTIPIGGLNIAFPAGSTISKKINDTFTVVELNGYAGLESQVGVHVSDNSDLTAASFANSEKKWFGTSVSYTKTAQKVDPVSYPNVNGTTSTIALDQVFDVAHTRQQYLAAYYDDTTEKLLVLFAEVKDPAGGTVEFDVEVDTTADTAAKKALDYNFAQIASQISLALHNHDS